MTHVHTHTPRTHTHTHTHTHTQYSYMTLMEVYKMHGCRVIDWLVNDPLSSSAMVAVGDDKHTHTHTYIHCG